MQLNLRVFLPYIDLISSSGYKSLENVVCCIYFLTFDIETLLPCLLSGASSLLGATCSTICTNMIGIKRISIISAQTRSMVFSTNKVEVKEGKTHKKINYLCSRCCKECIWIKTWDFSCSWFIRVGLGSGT